MDSTQVMACEVKLQARQRDRWKSDTEERRKATSTAESVHACCSAGEQRRARQPTALRAPSGAAPGRAQAGCARRGT